MKKLLNKISIKIVITTILLIVVYALPTYADVGSFESYDSGSSWDSGWDSESSWDSDWGSYSSYGGSNTVIIGGGWYFVIFAIIVIIAIAKANGKNHNRSTHINYTNINTTVYNENQIIEKIKQIDEQFNEEEFKSFAREVFVKLQNAWTDRDWEKIRPFESNELFEQHRQQLEGYIKNNQINVMERICVNWVRFLSFEQSGGKDILKVDLNSRMGDYIIDATTKKVIKGNKTSEYYHTYTLTFIRKTGMLTNTQDEGLNTTNCPNCGAPTKVTSAGRCEYCNSVITTEDHGWVLSNLNRKN